jgi:secreted trypsin-like serine protease
MLIRQVAAALALFAATAASAEAGSSSWRDVVKAREAAVAARLGIEIPRDAVTPQVIGGTVAPAGRWPFTVGLLSKAEPDNYYAQFCGASLIAARFVLTAAHCVEGAAPGDLQILVGTQDLENGGRRIDVADFMMHPQYDPQTFDYDVAVIKLAAPSGINAATSLPTRGESDFYAAPAKQAFIMGWGDTDASFGVDYPTLMQQATIRVIATSVCNASTSYDGAITPRMICAGVMAGGRDTCQGDSGGPMVVRDRSGNWKLQVGIVSWGFACAIPNFPGVYTKVSSLRPWIVGATAALLKSPRPIAGIAPVASR